MWKVESYKFVIVRYIIIDAINYLINRPIVGPEDVTIETPQNKADVSEPMSKSVVKSQKYERLKPE